MPTNEQTTDAATTEWLNQKGAAAYLGCTDRSIRAFIAQGRLPAYRFRGGRSIRIKRTDLEAMLVRIPTTAA